MIIKCPLNKLKEEETMLDTREVVVKMVDTKKDFEKIMVLREKVFVKETGLDKEPWDKLDDSSTHFLVLYKERPICCMRLLPQDVFSLQNILPLPPEIRNFREMSRLAVDPEFRNSNILLKLFVEVLRYCQKERIDYVVALSLLDVWRHFGYFKDIVHFLSEEPLDIKSSSGKPVKVLPLYIKIEDVSKII